ncbi:MAG: FAD-dependent oxidoreductase [Bacteroidetes bacterium]|nr:FAD-dependent oxidoreductase [Bacteroidota bacterium]
MTMTYDSVVIGGGAAGLTTAGISANFGAKTLMIEQDKLGGDCTWTGCVPSKTLLQAAKVLHNARNASTYGLSLTLDKENTTNVLAHVDRIRREIYEDADRPEIFEEMGIEVLQGLARFKDDHTIQIESKDGSTKEVTGKYIFICSGAKPSVPPIPGIGEIDFLTNESLFEIDSLPKKMIVVGGGPIGTEMAQAFNRLGTDVHVIDIADQILRNDDPELSEMLLKILKSEGIQYSLGANIRQIQKRGNRVELQMEIGGKAFDLEGDEILFATGRKANLSGLNLDLAGVEYSEKGITVNEKCRTNVSHIYAVGDVTGEYQFTHMSEHMAKVAATNALIKIPMKLDRKHVPWVTYTDPELGHIGATEKELVENGSSYEIYRFPFSKIDRAVTDGNSAGLIKIYAKKWSGKILGASVLGVHAGEMISQYALAMKNSVSLRDFADTIHPYPSYGLGARRAADQWYIKNQSETMVKWIKRIFGYRGSIPDYSDPDRIV